MMFFNRRWRASPAPDGYRAAPRGIIERQTIHLGNFASVPDLMIKIRAFIGGSNDRAGRSCDQDTRRNPQDYERCLDHQ
jgi:hypothetical protein